MNGARITDADTITGTGILHVVDKVIYPLPVGNVVQTLVDVEAFSVIVDLLKQVKLSEALEGKSELCYITSISSVSRI